MGGEEEPTNWSEKVEDLVESGNTDAAISFLESLVSHLQTLNSPDSQRQSASALFELVELYSSKDLSLKSDEARSRASAINLRSFQSISPTENSAGKESRVSTTCSDNLSSSGLTKNEGDSEEVANSPKAAKESSDDDWEAMADRTPDELLSPQSLPEVSKLSLKDSEKQVPKRRGRGAFAYKKHGLYSDQQFDDTIAYDSPDEDVPDKPEKVSEARNSVCGTHHALVLDGFHPSTTTADLERLFEDFKDRGFSIRWINDTLALAVFRTPSVALEARNSLKCPFSVCVLEEDDPVMSSISVKDLDPPGQRPKTSARTARRLIAQELGVKMPLTFGSRELRKQEDARRNRIVTRQNLRDDAWGPDDELRLYNCTLILYLTVTYCIFCSNEYFFVFRY